MRFEGGCWSLGVKAKGNIILYCPRFCEGVTLFQEGESNSFPGLMISGKHCERDVSNENLQIV